MGESLLRLDVIPVVMLGGGRVIQPAAVGTIPASKGDSASGMGSKDARPVLRRCLYRLPCAHAAATPLSEGRG